MSNAAADDGYEAAMKRINPNYRPFEFRKAPPEEVAILRELVALAEDEAEAEKKALADWLNG